MLSETVWTTGEGSRFSARTVAVLSSDRVRDSKGGTRPLLLAVLADAGAARPIAACVRLRGELEIGGSSGRGGASAKYELLRTAGYRQSAQHVGIGTGAGAGAGGTGSGATILQWHLPGYFELDPGARADGGGADTSDDAGRGGDDDSAAAAPGAATFIVMPTTADLAREVASRDPAEVEDVIEWLTRDTSVLAGRWGDRGSGEDRFRVPKPDDPPYLRTGAPVARAALAEAVAWAPLLAAYVDRRVTSPMLRDLRYQALLLCALVEFGSASWPSTCSGWGHVHEWRTDDLACKGLEDLGWAAPLVVAPRGAGLLDALVVECVRSYEAARRGGRDAYTQAVLDARKEYAERVEARRAAAVKRGRGR